jgi:hypothetical protein
MAEGSGGGDLRGRLLRVGVDGSESLTIDSPRGKSHAQLQRWTCMYIVHTYRSVTKPWSDTRLSGLDFSGCPYPSLSLLRYRSRFPSRTGRLVIALVDGDSENYAICENIDLLYQG